MTREILFRGKRLENGEWVYGAYHKHDTVKVCIAGDDPKTKHIIIADGFCDWGFEPPLMGYHVDPSTVGQYTGLTANGKKIFEGDIVKFTRFNALGYATRRTGVVRYYEKLPVFYIEATTGDAWDWCDCDAIEVIGNIHDNRELLEGEG